MISIPAWALPALLGLGSVAAALVVAGRAPITGPVAAVFPPWWQSARVVAAAGSVGRVLRLGSGGFVVIVAPEGDGIAARLRAAGALLVAEPQSVSLCSAVAASL